MASGSSRTAVIRGRDQRQAGALICDLAIQAQALGRESVEGVAVAPVLVLHAHREFVPALKSGQALGYGRGPKRGDCRDECVTAHY